MGELADVRYFPEIDYVGLNYQPLGKRIIKEGITEEDIIFGPKEDLCSRCIHYYKNLGARNVIDKWPIKCTGDRSKKIETVDPGILATLDEEEKSVLVATLDPAVWAKRFLNFEARWYQTDMLNCSSQFKVVRAGRRVGKTETMSVKILHSAFTKNGKDVGRYVILIVCPYEAQVKAIFDNILALKNRSPELIESFDGSSMSPWEIRWKNGSVIKGFSAAKKTSARSNKIRGQGAHEIYFDEIDYMADDDIETVMAVLLDQPDTSVWMSSTPTGARSRFWQMCVDKSKGFKEFHFISKESPIWKPHIEELMIGMYSQGGYDREFNAEFGQPMQGVFRQKDLDRARFKWDYSKAKRVDNTHLVMGVDWNKHTGTHIVLLESGITDSGPLYKVVYKEVIRKSEFTQHEGVEAILRLDREWHPDYIYVDEGYGAMQVEALWRYDKLNPQLRLDYAKRIRKVQGNENVIIPNPLGGDPIKKMSKPFMIDSLAHWLELGYLKIPECEDTQTALIEAEIPFVNIGLIQQMREFRVEKYSPSGQPRYSQGYEHTLMALGFAALGTLMNFSELKQTISTVQAVYDPHLFTDKPKPPNELDNVKTVKGPSVAETAARLKPGRVIPGAGIGLPGVGGNFYRKTGLSDLGSGKLGLGTGQSQTGRGGTRPDRTIP